MTTDLLDDHRGPLSFEREEANAISRIEKVAAKIEKLLEGDLRLVRNRQAGTIKERPAKVEVFIDSFPDGENPRCNAVPFVTFHGLVGVVWDKIRVLSNGIELTKAAIPPFDDTFVRGESVFEAGAGRHQITLPPKLTGPPAACAEAKEMWLERFTNPKLLVAFEEIE